MKTCDSCGEKNRSEEWSLSAELAKNNRRLFIVILVLIFLWFSTIFGFVWYLNQYDYAVYDVDMDALDGGNANYIGNDGDIYNGTGYGTPKNAS